MKRFIQLTLSFIICQLSFSPAGAQTATDIINQMSPGWNLGNTFEAKHWNGADLFNNKAGLAAETSWQDTRTTQQVIDFVKAQGFRSVRIPVAWVCGHISNATNYTIDPNWMKRVKQVVDYCINDGLYVVLNDHWDGGWLENHIADTDAATVEKNKAVLTAIWTQIAETFRDYDDHLLFAGLNEPNTEDTPKASTMNNLIMYNQTFIDAVRATGGHNATRVLVVQGPSTDIGKTVKQASRYLKLTDSATDRLAIEVHYYAPWQFWGMEQDESWGKVFYYWGSGNHHSGSQHNATHSEESFMKQQLQQMKTMFVDKGMPVVIGEFGANWRDLSGQKNESQEKHNASIRAHYRELHRLCKELGGMVPMTWDINARNQNGTKGTMTIIDRKTLSIYGPHALAGIQDVWPAPSTESVSQPTTTDAAPTGVYNLQGQRVADAPSELLPSGIYLYQGEKYAKR